MGEGHGVNGGMQKRGSRRLSGAKEPRLRERAMARITIIRRPIQTANCVILRILCGREVARRRVLTCSLSEVHYKPDFVESRERLAFAEHAKPPGHDSRFFFTRGFHLAITLYVSQSVKLEPRLAACRRNSPFDFLRRSPFALSPRSCLHFLARSRCRRVIYSGLSRWCCLASCNFAREARGKKKRRMSRG